MNFYHIIFIIYALSFISSEFELSLGKIVSLILVYLAPKKGQMEVPILGEIG